MSESINLIIPFSYTTNNKFFCQNHPNKYIKEINSSKNIIIHTSTPPDIKKMKPIIKSSFKKVQKPSTSNNKCHFGHPELDTIFNCSLSKGHLMVLQQDHPTMNYISLLRYYISSNYHAGIPSLIYDLTPGKWSQLISPVDKKTGKEKDKQTEDKSKKSQIAWRYNNQTINLNELIVNENMHFYDLNKQVQKVDESLLLKQSYPEGDLAEFYRQIQEKFLELNQDEKDTRPKKILLSSIPSYFYQQPQFWQFIKALRCLTRSSHVFTLLTLPPIISQQIRTRLIYFSDYYLQIGKVGKGYKDFTGSISVLKQVETCNIRTNYRGVSIWGIKNKKKEFRIQSLYEQAVEEGDNELMGEEERDNKAKGKKEKIETSIDF